MVLVCADLLPELDKEIPRAWVIAVTKGIIYALPVVSLAAALLMVSRISYPHVIDQYVRGRRSFAHVVRVLLLLLVLYWQPQATLAIAFVGFAGSGAAKWAWKKYIKKAPFVVQTGRDEASGLC